MFFLTLTKIRCNSFYFQSLQTNCQDFKLLKKLQLYDTITKNIQVISRQAFLIFVCCLFHFVYYLLDTKLFINNFMEPLTSFSEITSCYSHKLFKNNFKELSTSLHPPPSQEPYLPHILFLFKFLLLFFFHSFFLCEYRSEKKYVYIIEKT